MLQDLLASREASIAVGVLAAYGAVSVLSKSWAFVNFVKRHTCRRPHNMMARYGRPGSYVVVTGGSDGIGLEISH